MDGGYKAANGGRTAPVHREVHDGVVGGEDFPQLCETCLGQNPYVRMVKLPYGQKICKISNLGYQAFRWKAGPQGRYKETIISFAVAKERNICQTCLNDMVYGLPVGVRDALLKSGASSSGTGTNSSGQQQLSLPSSEVGSRYHYQQLEANSGLVEYNSAASVSDAIANIGPARELDAFSKARLAMDQKNKTSFRNLPKLCSFWLNGTCGRVGRKTCPFRPCCGVFVFPELAGSKTGRPIMEKLVKELESKGPAAVQTALDAETKAAFRESMKGNRDNAIKARVFGEDDLSRKYLGAIRSQSKKVSPPEDESICTLWVGNVEPIVLEQDLFDAFYSFGSIVGINILRTGRCAFVEFSNRPSAEAAAAAMYNALTIKGHELTLNWAKPRGGGSSSSEDASAAVGPTSGAMPAPPGMEHASVAQYSIPNMSRPVIVPLSAPPPPPGPPPGSSSSSSSSSSSTSAASTDVAASDAADQQPAKKARTEQPASDTSTDTAPAALHYGSMNPQRLGSSV